MPRKVALVSVCVTRIKSGGGGGASTCTNSYRLPNAASGVQFGHGCNFLHVVQLVLPKIGVNRGMARKYRILKVREGNPIEEHTYDYIIHCTSAI